MDYFIRIIHENYKLYLLYQRYIQTKNNRAIAAKGICSYDSLENKPCCLPSRTISSSRIWHLGRCGGLRSNLFVGCGSGSSRAACTHKLKFYKTAACLPRAPQKVKVPYRLVSPSHA